MLSQLGRRRMIGDNDNSFGDEFEKEMGLLLREQRRQDADELEKDLNLYRSGSAPPTVEGSLSAVGGLFNHGAHECVNNGSQEFAEFASFKNGNEFSSEEDLRSDPKYLSYYYSNVNLNPRLPPPLLSREDWRFAQRLQGGSSAIGDRRKVNKNDSDNGGRSMFAMPPPGFNSKKQESESEDTLEGGNVEWGGDGLIGLPGLGLGSKQKSLAEIFQDDLSRSTPASRHPSRPASRNAFDEAGAMSCVDPSTQSIVSSSAASYSYAAALGGALSRSSTPDPQRIARAPSPIGGGRAANPEKRSFNIMSSHPNPNVDLVAAFSGVNLSNGIMDEENHLTDKKYVYNLTGGHSRQQQPYMETNENTHFDISSSSRSRKLMNSDSIVNNVPLLAELQNNNIPCNNLYPKAPSHAGLSHYQHLDSTTNSSFSNCGYPMSPISSQLNSSNLPPLFENAAAASAMGLPGMDARMLGGSILGNQQHSPYVDPLYLQYVRTAEYAAAAAQVAALNDPSIGNNSYMDPIHKAYLGNLLSSHQKPQMRPSSPHGYYMNPTFGIGLPYPGSVVQGGLGSPLRHGGDFNTRFSGGMRNVAGSVIGPWHFDSMENTYASSLLEEFKSNKTKCFELSDIAGHVVEFSADQYGSRFIQQKLEAATMEEKNMVFVEIFPQALALMTDVFGNYVIQKFFEHGMVAQRRELAGKLFGHVLNLSLQMYGCRVIQKVIEVVDVDQKIKMVEELDGHIMRCVRDQNGNHVIQKCIECVPEEHIQFIVSSFFDQVVTLSTHPYGCRVIQRVLEHCKDEQTQSKVMEEILGAVSMLAQDQYGNYVVQHVLEHGKRHEQSTIIQELAGKIVQMSHQKFASNVVEKCLTFGDPTQRQLLVNEMLCTTDDNEPLQAMMKDQFANYVVQKVLEICSDEQREMIMSRIKVHLNALKKYTYGKHIVARVEKLVAAGERRIAAQTQQSA